MASSDIDLELFGDFVSESIEALEGTDALFVKLEDNPEDSETIDTIFRTMHSVKGNSSFLGLLHIQEFAHKLETYLDRVRHGSA